MTASKNGIALVFVSGILVLFSFLALLFAREGRLAAGSGGAILDAREADLAAGSGLEYAAARLWSDEESISDKGQAPSAANTCDDWTARNQGSDNPSYARGDRYQDADNDGAHDAGETLFPGGDLDGDGIFDAWSGRLRGAFPSSGRFALRITETACGRICVNSGETGSLVDDHDADGVLDRDDFLDNTPYLPDRDGNGTDDYCDPEFYGNTHLVNTLDNLGAVVGLPDAAAVPFAPPPSQPQDLALLLGEITLSKLGRVVVENRPKGGYGSIDELREQLVPAHYTASAFEKVAPFLTVHGQAVTLSTSTPSVDTYQPHAPEDGAKYERRVPVDLLHAPVEVLQALLRHTAASGTGTFLPQGNFSPLQTFVRLGEGEADDLAQGIVESRSAGPFHTWGDLLALLESNRNLFRQDPFVAAYVAAYGIAIDRFQVHAKQDLILTQLDLNWQFPDAYARGRNTLEVPRENPPVGNGPEAPRRMHRPAVTGTLNTRPFLFPKATGGPSGTLHYHVSQIPNRSTMGGSLCGSAGAFRVESDGWRSATRRSVSGDLLLSTGALLLGSQQDFTPLFSSGVDGDPNPAVWRLPGGAVSYDGTQAALRDGIQSFPRFPLVGPDGHRNNIGIDAPEGQPENYRYPRGHGGLQLAARQFSEAADGTPLWLGNPDISFAIPHNEDGIPSTRNIFDHTGWSDNAGDPIVRPGSPPETHWQSPAYPVIGTRFSPFGQRGGSDATMLTASWKEMPLEYSDVSVGYIPGSAHASTPPSPRSMAEEGTFMFWYLSMEDAGLVSPPPLSGLSLTVSYFSYKDVANPWFGLAIDARTDTIRFWTNDPLSTSGTNHLNSTFQPAPAASSAISTGWHCAVLRFKRDLSVQVAATPHAHLQPPVAADLLVDGVQVNPAPIPIFLQNVNFSWTSSPPRPEALYPDLYGKPRLEISLMTGGMDDLSLFRRWLTDDEIRDIARIDRHARAGRYRSQRFRFDPAALPQGAIVRRVAWDAFLPQAAGALVTFTVSAHDANGNKLAERSNAGDPYRIGEDPWFRLEEIPAAASIDYAIEITTNAAGLLSASPLIEEVRIEYGGARPRWSNIADR